MSGVSAAPSNYPGSATQAEPKKETARISILPEPAPASAVKMTKTQPLLAIPAAKPAAAPVIIKAPVGRTAVPIVSTGVEAIPMPLLWGACGVSAVTLIIQIWNYFGS